MAYLIHIFTGPFIFKALRAVRRARFLDFCIIFDTLLRPWSVFWSHFCYFIVILGALWQHFLHQELDWSAKAATGGAKGQNATNPSPFWTPLLTDSRHIFKTSATFFHVFSRRCSSHAFLVYLCTFSDDFSTHFVCHVICARSDLDCTGMAQTHVLTFERPEKLQKNRAEKYSDLKVHFQWILTQFWVHVLTKI